LIVGIEQLRVRELWMQIPELSEVVNGISRHCTTVEIGEWVFKTTRYQYDTRVA
jgi:hypothetical protein